MDKFARNEGIFVTGGSINADQIAVGKHARTIKYLAAANEVLDQKDLQEIRDKLNELVQAVNNHADSLPNPGEVRDATASVAEQLAQDKPNKLTISAILSGIAENVTSVAAIATSVEALRAAVAILL